MTNGPASSILPAPSTPGTSIATTAAARLAALPPGAERAMLLLVSLDEEVATRVISHLAEPEVAMLRRATESLREVEPAMLARIHREFLSRVRAGLPTSLQGSGAYLRRLVGNALGEGKAAEIWMERQRKDGDAPAFAQMDAGVLATLLESEHPQTAAIVLSQIEPPKAADALAKMRPERRAEILHRVSQLESVPEAVIIEIEREFAGYLSRMGDERRQVIPGKEAAAAILKRMRQEDTQFVIDELARSSPEIAERLKQALFTFEDLLRVDGRGMQQLLKEVPTDQLVLALKTASEELREKVFGNLSSRAAEMLREDLGSLGPVKVSDVEDAQRAIVDIALDLERDGRIAIAREGGGDYV